MWRRKASAVECSSWSSHISCLLHPCDKAGSNLELFACAWKKNNVEAAIEFVADMIQIDQRHGGVPLKAMLLAIIKNHIYVGGQFSNH